MQQWYGPTFEDWPPQADMFCHTAMQALIDGKVLCVHGGLSPDIRTLDQVCLCNMVNMVIVVCWSRGLPRVQQGSTITAWLHVNQGRSSE